VTDRVTHLSARCTLSLQVLVELGAHVVDVLSLEGEAIHGAQAAHGALRPRKRVLEHRVLELHIS